MIHLYEPDPPERKTGFVAFMKDWISYALIFIAIIATACAIGVLIIRLTEFLGVDNSIILLLVLLFIFAVTYMTRLHRR